jgi:hypothetical protein
MLVFYENNLLVSITFSFNPFQSNAWNGLSLNGIIKLLNIYSNMAKFFYPRNCLVLGPGTSYNILASMEKL